MPNYLETTEIITRYLKARVPLIVVKSTEPVRVFSILRTISTNIPSLPFFYYSAADAGNSPPTSSSSKTNPSPPPSTRQKPCSKPGET